MFESALEWLFDLSWWQMFRNISKYGAPIVSVIGISWYIYDRKTGGI